MSAPALSPPPPAARPYHPYGAALELLYCRDREVVLSGPAGTGKSRACLEKLYLCAEKYAGMRGLILRKTRESLTEAALVTFEDKVVPAGHPILRGAQRRMRQAYHFPNGSEIVVGGLDKAQKVMSTEYDMVYVQEAIECAEDDWEKVTTRLRNGVMPYQQLLGDTNPDAPTHWLKLRADGGRLRLMESRHEDNPTLVEPATGLPTPAGAQYIAALDALTGVRFLRLRKGLWVAAEGLVYEGWDPALHLVDRFEIPADWPRYWVVDFGFTNPFVWQAWAQDPDGRLYRYREIYRTRQLVEDMAPEILRATESEPQPRVLVCDHDAEGRATLERHLEMATTPAYKGVADGIQAVAARLKTAGDGRPRAFLLRDSLAHPRDPDLEQRKLPCCTEEEVGGYVWDTSARRKQGEEPVKKDDHGCDAWRYVTAHVDAIRHGALQEWFIS